MVERAGTVIYTISELRVRMLSLSLFPSPSLPLIVP
jgi:hypothetical protein